MNTVPWVTIDPVKDGEGFYSQPAVDQPVYRAQLPTGQPIWVVTHYEDAAAILRDTRFSQTQQGTLTPEERAALPQVMTALSTGTNMLDADPPVHTRLRGLVHKAFTPRLIDGMRPRIEQIVDTLFDEITARGDGRMEFIEDFAFPMPVTVIAELLGLPTADRDRFRAWTEVLTSVSPEDLARADELAVTALEFTQYLADQFDDKRQQPADDLISGLVAAHDQGDKLDDAELHGMVLLLLAAGHETTVNLLGSSVLALLQHPDQLARLRADESLIETAVEEFLRFCGPVHWGPRYARERIPFREVVFERGDMLFIQLATANRDPQRFDAPDRLDVTRPNNKHLSFGQGIHYCLGAPLARLEASTALRTLLRRFPNLALDGDRFQRGANLFTFGVRTLHLTY